MSTVLPTHPKPLPVAQLSGRPSTRSLLRWGALVLVLHLVVLLSLAGTLDWQLSTPQTLRTGPMQTRTLTVPAAAPTASEQPSLPGARTRVALVEKSKPASPPKTTTPKTAAPSPKPQAAAPAEQTPSPDPIPASNQDLPATSNLTRSDPLQPQDHANSSDLNDSVPKSSLPATTDPQAGTVVAETPAGAPSSPVTVASQPVTTSASPSTATPTLAPKPIQISDSDPPLLGAANAPAGVPTDNPQPTQTPAPPNSQTEAFQPSPNPAVATSDATAKPATPSPERIASATLALPELALASLPPSALLNYRLSGQEKGINYQASGELRWQRNDSAYAMSLSVKAFLLGSRHWRSVGQINATGLAPTRFSDSWRSERVAHFDRPNQRIVFSNNAPTMPLQPGAQDQVSLYVQLAAAMAQSGQRMPPGTRLQIQTATVRDALPWLLTLEKLETLQVDGQSLQTIKWVCQPRNRFDAQVEFWVSAAHDWLPARIRITQASGSFIDLQLTGREALADLPPVQ